MPKILAWTEEALTISALRDRQYQPSSGIDVPDRALASTTGVQSNGVLRVVFFTPTRTLTVSNFTIACTTGALDTGGGTTVRRLGLFTYNSGAGTITCVARSANDANLGQTSSTLYPKPFTSEAGYSSSYTIVAGTTYAAGVLFYNTGGTFAGPTLASISPPSGTILFNNTSLLPLIVGGATGQTDITNSPVTLGTTVGAAPYIRLT